MYFIFHKAFKYFRNLHPENRQRITFLISAILALTVSTVFFSIKDIKVLEWKIVDGFIKKTGDTKDNKDVVVIGIDENFIESKGWPLDKDVYGEIIFYLKEMGAKVTAIDVNFSDKHEDCTIPEEERGIFESTLNSTPNVVLIYTPVEWRVGGERIKVPVVSEKYSIGKGQVPNKHISRALLPYAEVIASNPMLAHHNLAPAYEDGLKRRLPLLQSSAGFLFPSYSLISASLFLDSAEIKWDSTRQKIHIGANQIPVDFETNMFINFESKIPFFDVTDIYMSFQDYLEGKSPKVGREQLEGKLVFLGASAPSLGDNTVTPMTSSRVRGISEIPKVTLQAQAAATIINNQGYQFFGRKYAVIFSFLLIVVFAFIIQKFQIRTVYIINILIGVGCYFLAQYLHELGFIFHIAEGLTAGVVFTFLGSIAIFLEKDLDKKFLFDSFKTYLSEELIDEMYENRIAPKLGGAEGVRTAFFSDVQSFSTFSEAIGSPTRLVELLNEYLTDMTDILMENSGTLDKYEGDAIIAFFGAPVEMPDHPEKAAVTALAMQKKLGELREKWKGEGDKWPEIVKNMRMRIGLNTGPMVTGNMGSKMRMNYTMMGDTVNLAARLESGAKQYGVYTLVSGETAKLISENIIKRKIDSIRVVGKTLPVDVYELICFKEEVTPEIEECIDLFNRGREFYLAQKWSEAANVFSKCVEKEPFHPHKIGTGSTCPSQVFLKRCIDYQKSPPKGAAEGSWDGVFTASEK